MMITKLFIGQVKVKLEIICKSYVTWINQKRAK